MCNKEEFEETKGVIRIQKSTKDCQHNGKKKEQTMIYETLNIKIKIVVIRNDTNSQISVNRGGEWNDICYTDDVILANYLCNIAGYG
jgi:hypothetical protein